MADEKKPAKPTSKKGEAATVTKKIKAYPFDALVDFGAQKKQVAVLLINREGLLARVDKVLVQVGSYHNLEFTLPLSSSLIVVRSRVLKTYDKALDPKGQTVERMAEFRFEKLTEDQRNHISTFMASIGQKK